MTAPLVKKECFDEFVRDISQRIERKVKPLNRSLTGEVIFDVVTKAVEHRRQFKPGSDFDQTDLSAIKGEIIPVLLNVPVMLQTDTNLFIIRHALNESIREYCEANNGSI